MKIPLTTWWQYSVGEFAMGELTADKTEHNCLLQVVHQPRNINAFSFVFVACVACLIHGIDRL